MKILLNSKMQLLKLLMVVVTVVIHTACATLPSGNKPVAVPNDVFADPYYQILLAELAQQHGETEVATAAYERSLDLYAHFDVAKNAYRYAARNDQQELAARAAAHWAKETNDPKAQIAMASEALNKNDSKTAAEYFARYLSNTNDTDTEGFSLVAAGVLQKKYLSQAPAVLTYLVEKFPNRIRGRVAKAQAEYENDNIQNALNDIDQALQQKPSMEDAQIFKAQILLQEGRGREALTGVEQAIIIIPDSIMLRRMYAQLLLDNSRHDDARYQFEQLLSNNPNDVKSLYALAALELEREHMYAARGYYQRLLVIDGESDNAAYYLGRIAEHLGDESAAYDWYQKVSNGKRLLDSQQRSIAIKLRNDDVTGATNYLRQLRQLWPQHATTYFLMEAAIWDDAGQLSKALNVYNEALLVKPTDEELRYNRAVIYLKQQQLQPAEKDLRYLLAQDSENPMILNTLGYGLLELSDRYQEAKNLIEKALSLAPNAPEILDSMGWAEFKLGNYEAAEPYLRKAYELSPDPEIAAHLGELLWYLQPDQATDVWRDGLTKGEPSRRYYIVDTMRRLAPELVPNQ